MVKRYGPLQALKLFVPGIYIQKSQQVLILNCFLKIDSNISRAFLLKYDDSLDGYLLICTPLKDILFIST